MGLRRICFQLHWFLGITTGMFLVVMGLSGALLSFQEEIVGWLNPGALHAAPDPVHERLAPAALLAAMRAGGDTRPIARVELYAASGRNPRITFAPTAQYPHGETAWANAHTGEPQHRLRSMRFFAWVERLHIWLLLPARIGQPATGILAASLLALGLLGLYLRWPAKPWSARAWLHLPLHRKGRHFLWGLHSVAGTWVLLIHVVLAGTGMYWGLPPLRAWVDTRMGVPARAAPSPPATTPVRVQEHTPVGPADLGPAWRSFEQAASGWRYVQIRLPLKTGQDFQFNWYAADAAHEMARNRLTVAADGTVRRDDRFDSLPAARRALAAVYPLHMGSYFGLPGRIAAMLASLAIPLFAITGWMLYLGRRRRKARSLAREPSLHENTDTARGNALAAIAVIHASQSGTARELARRTAEQLRRAGCAVDVFGASRASQQTLAAYQHTLWIASTFGDGGPPDEARDLLRSLRTMALRTQAYAVLALGDSQYENFCAFGLLLHTTLKKTFAQPLFDPVAMDAENPLAWRTWCSSLAEHWHMPPDESPVPNGHGSFMDYRLVRRAHCNPRSPGAPLYRLELQPATGPLPVWQAGALAEILPRNAYDAVQKILDAGGCSGDEPVACHNQTMSLREALSTSILPQRVQAAAGLESVPAVLRPITPRSYSIGSLPDDGCIQLWVRQAGRGGNRPGLASDWLTRHLPLGATVRLRLRANAGFAPSLQPGQAAIFIGSGSGYAGLRAHLLARIRSGLHDNWLIFGERQRHADGWAEDEARAWLACGHLLRADFAYSRDTGGPRHVQDIVRENSAAARRWIMRGAAVYVCGRRQGMASDVQEALVQLLGSDGFEHLAASGRYLRDVY